MRKLWILALIILPAALSCIHDEPTQPDARSLTPSFNISGSYGLIGGPYGSTVPTNGTAWISQSTNGTVVKMDVAQHTFSNSISLGAAGVIYPFMMASNQDGSRVYVGTFDQSSNNRGIVAAIYTTESCVHFTSPPCLGSSYTVAGDISAVIAQPTGNIVYVGVTDGPIHKVSMAQFGGGVVTSRTNLGTAYAYHFAWNRDRTSLYASSYGTGVYKLDPATLLDQVPHYSGTTQTQGLALSADGTKLYVASQAGDVKVLDAVSLAPVGTITTGCHSISLLLANNRLYDACTTDGKVVVVDPLSNMILETDNVGGRPRELSYDPGTGMVVAPNETGNKVDVLAPPVSGTPDPTLLQVAAGQQWSYNYNATLVQSLAAGYSYQDGTTGVKIYKITSGSPSPVTFPAAASSGWGHDYAEGGDEISLPYKGNTRAVLVHDWSATTWWLVDFTPGAAPAVSNPRQLIGDLAPWSDGAFTFSSNPNTPFYAYVGTASRVKRIDISQNSIAEAPGLGWPSGGIPESHVRWLHQSEGDAFFTWIRDGNLTHPMVVVGYQPSTGALKTHDLTDPNHPLVYLDQPQINRNSGVRQVAINNEVDLTCVYSPPTEYCRHEQMLLWDFDQGTIICTTPGSDSHDPNHYPQFNHMAALHDRWMGLNWNTDGPPRYYDRFYYVQGNTQCAYDNLGGPTNANAYYANGNWNQHPASLNDQWELVSEEAWPFSGSGYLAPGGMVYVKDDDPQHRYLLAFLHNKSTSPTNYAKLSFPKQSSDGRYVLFTSNMDQADGSRTDVFLAEVPVRP